MYKFIKIVFISVFITILAVFSIASIRTFSLDVNAGLQLAQWEKTNNMSLVIDHHQREELLAKFKGNGSLQMTRKAEYIEKKCRISWYNLGRNQKSVSSFIQRRSESLQCPQRRKSTPQLSITLESSSVKVKPREWTLPAPVRVRGFNSFLITEHFIIVSLLQAT